MGAGRRQDLEAQGFRGPWAGPTPRREVCVQVSSPTSQTYRIQASGTSRLEMLPWEPPPNVFTIYPGIYRPSRTHSPKHPDPRAPSRPSERCVEQGQKEACSRGTQENRVWGFPGERPCASHSYPRAFEPAISSVCPLPGQLPLAIGSQARETASGPRRRSISPRVLTVIRGCLAHLERVVQACRTNEYVNEWRSRVLLGRNSLAALFKEVGEA